MRAVIFCLLVLWLHGLKIHHIIMCIHLSFLTSFSLKVSKQDWSKAFVCIFFYNDPKVSDVLVGHNHPVPNSGISDSGFLPLSSQAKTLLMSCQHVKSGSHYSYVWAVKYWEGQRRIFSQKAYRSWNKHSVQLWWGEKHLRNHTRFHPSTAQKLNWLKIRFKKTITEYNF